MSEARTADRLDRLEHDVAAIKTTLGRLAPMIERIDATLPHLATKAEAADLRTELKGDIANLRTELKRDIANLRTELKGEIGDIKTAIARLPTHAYLWAVMAAIFAAQAVAIGAGAWLR